MSKASLTLCLSLLLFTALSGCLRTSESLERSKPTSTAPVMMTPQLTLTSSIPEEGVATRQTLELSALCQDPNTGIPLEGIRLSLLLFDEAQDLSSSEDGFASGQAHFESSEVVTDADGVARMVLHTGMYSARYYARVIAVDYPLSPPLFWNIQVVSDSTLVTTRLLNLESSEVFTSTNEDISLTITYLHYDELGLLTPLDEQLLVAELLTPDFESVRTFAGCALDEVTAQTNAQGRAGFDVSIGSTPTRFYVRVFDPLHLETTPALWSVTVTADALDSGFEVTVYPDDESSAYEPFGVQSARIFYLNNQPCVELNAQRADDLASRSTEKLSLNERERYTTFSGTFEPALNLSVVALIYSQNNQVVGMGCLDQLETRAGPSRPISILTQPLAPKWREVYQLTQHLNLSQALQGDEGFEMIELTFALFQLIGGASVDVVTRDRLCNYLDVVGQGACQTLSGQRDFQDYLNALSSLLSANAKQRLALLGQMLTVIRSAHFISEVTIDPNDHRAWRRDALLKWVGVLFPNPLCLSPQSCLEQRSLEMIQVPNFDAEAPFTFELTSPHDAMINEHTRSFPYGEVISRLLEHYVLPGLYEEPRERVPLNEFLQALFAEPCADITLEIDYDYGYRQCMDLFVIHIPDRLSNELQRLNFMDDRLMLRGQAELSHDQDATVEFLLGSWSGSVDDIELSGCFTGCAEAVCGMPFLCAPP